MFLENYSKYRKPKDLNCLFNIFYELGYNFFLIILSLFNKRFDKFFVVFLILAILPIK